MELPGGDVGFGIEEVVDLPDEGGPLVVGILQAEKLESAVFGAGDFAVNSREKSANSSMAHPDGRKPFSSHGM
jgi:hypothetical protein